MCTFRQITLFEKHVFSMRVCIIMSDLLRAALPASKESPHLNTDFCLKSVARAIVKENPVKIVK